MSAIEVRGLTKSYRAVRAVDDLTLEVPEGTLFAFLGANGAGKTTTISCLTTLLAFDSGTVEVAGHDVVRDGPAVRERIGVVFQESILDPALTVQENLSLRAALAGLDAHRAAARIDELAERIDIATLRGRRYGRLSGGQKRRVDIARALLHEPEVLFLDEPTAGLDPASRATVWQTMRELREQTGLTVFLTTHYMEETEQADRVCVIDAGRIVADDTPAALRARYSTSVLTVASADPEALDALATRDGLDAVRDGDAVRLTVQDAAQARRILAELGERVVDFEFRHGRMDDVFLALTGRTDGEAPADVEDAA